MAVFRAQKVLNGLFGVPKPALTKSGKTVLMVITNLVPSNSILRRFSGATKSLPHITSWLPTFVDEGEELKIWQSDMQNAFYLFRILHDGTDSQLQNHPPKMRCDGLWGTRLWFALHVAYCLWAGAHQSLSCKR